MRAILAARSVTGRWAALLAVTWAAVALLGGVAVPVQYPFEAHLDFVPSAVLVGLVVPVAVLSSALGDGSDEAVATASRRLWGTRVVVVALGAVVVILGSLGLSLLTTVPRALLVQDCLLLWGAGVAGVAVLGVALGWSAPFTFVLVASAPGLVPWQANLLYRSDLGAQRGLLAAVLLLVATATYAGTGAGGPRRRIRVRSRATA